MATQQVTHTLAHWARHLGRASLRWSWPVVLSAVFWVAAIGAFVTAWLIHSDAQALVAQATGLQSKSSRNLPTASVESNDIRLLAPSDSEYMQDLARIFKIATADAISLDAIDYRKEVAVGSGFTLRTVNLRVNEDYPKMKSFVANVLATFPHAALNEIRIERKDATTEQSSVLLKFALVYRTDAASSKADLVDKK